MAAKRSKQSPGGWRPGKEAINLYRDDLREALGRSGKTLATMRHDGTCDRDPALWDDFVAQATARGHRVILVTIRHDHVPIGRAPAGVPIYYTGRQAKRPYVAALGFEVDVWNDEPMWVLRDSSGGHIGEE